MSPLLLLKLALGTWWISYALTSTHGPGGVFEWIREHIWHGRHGNLITNHTVAGKPNEAIGQTVTVVHAEPAKNGLLDCIVCLAPWIAGGLMLVSIVLQIEWVIDLFAVAGAAILLHGYTGWRANY